MTNQPETRDGEGLALFYRDPQPLSLALHGDWRLKDGDLAFAADTPFAPIVVGELMAASADYPVLFASETAQPIVALSLERSNLFVADGAWEAGAYVPAYVRRYPFGFISTINPEGFALAIDAGSERVARGGEEGAPLFENGAPTDLTRQALSFCDAFQREAAATQAFGAALKAQGLLIDQRADATLSDGRKVGLDGFQVVDAERFAQLADAVVVEWHRKGWLALVHFHLASLDRFRALLDRAGRAPGPAEVSKPSSDAGKSAGKSGPRSPKKD